MLHDENIDFDRAMQRIHQATGTKTQVQLAEVLGIRQSSISDAKRRRSLPADWLLKLLEERGLNPTWIKTGQHPVHLKEELKNAFPVSERASGKGRPGHEPAGHDPSMSRVRSVKISTWQGSQNDTGRWIEMPYKRISIPEYLYSDSLVATRLDGQAMAPLLQRGALIGIDTEETIVVAGDIYAFHIPNEGLAVRRVFHDANGGTYLLRAEREEFPEFAVPNAEIAKYVLGKVVWVVQVF